MAGGKGVQGVEIYREYTYGAHGEIVATTDANGYYQSDYVLSLVTRPSRYMPKSRAIYIFAPDQEIWEHYYGYEERSIDFTAYPPVLYMPIILDDATLTTTVPSPSR